MITVTLPSGFSHVVKPTIFPDNTSQVWKLPEQILVSPKITITWNFEEEAEIMHLYSLVRLMSHDPYIHLHIPYFPYARQDKDVSNETTFNLGIFALLINQLAVDKVTALDIHNPVVTSRMIPRGFENVAPNLNNLIEKVDPDWLVAPDKGAASRYAAFTQHPTIVFGKTRDQTTGTITGMAADLSQVKSGQSFLIIDDICDGGATFCAISKMLHERFENIGVDLYVTHGIFSKGLRPLEAAGINEIYTTSSLGHKVNVNIIEV